MQTEPKPIHLQGGKIMKKAVKDSNLLELYTQMKRIRVFEQSVGELFARGQSAGSMLHLSIGEEAAAVGIGSSMRKGDSFTTHHRGHGIFLARGADPKLMMAEIAGKKTGYCQGKGGSMHIADMNLGHLGANAIVGGGIPAVIGAGIASKRQGKGSVSIAFFGDGAMQQGILYESMNMASLWNLPVMFVCINNQYGMGTRIDLATKETRLHLRAEAFGLHGKTVDGLDVLDVKSAAQKMIDEARGGTPSFLAIDCYRFHGHARMDKSPYRSNEEEIAGRKKDSVKFARDELIKSYDLKLLEILDKEINDEMDATIDFAENSKVPNIGEMFTDVYSPRTPKPESVRDRIQRILGSL